MRTDAEWDELLKERSYYRETGLFTGEQTYPEIEAIKRERLKREDEALERKMQGFEVLMREYPERYFHYLRLNFAHEEITRELLEDDGRWEEARELPIDPDNWVDEIIRMAQEQGYL